MDNNSVGYRLAKALETIFGSKNNKEVADKYNITQQAVGKLKTKKAINETICLISEGENINLNWLQTGKGSMFIENEKNVSKVSINNYIDIKAAAGTGVENYSNSSVPMQISKNYLRDFYNIHNVNTLDLITVEGNSMIPTIESEEQIFIDRSDIEIKDGVIFAIMYHDELYVKRVQKFPNKMRLISDNKDYLPIDIEGEDLNNIQIFGRVLLKSRFKLIK